MKNLFRMNYILLPEAEKQILLKKIAAKTQVPLKRFELFERYGQSTYTAVYEYCGSEFVFIPGDIVTLGWNSIQYPLEEDMEEYYRENLEEYKKKWKTYLHEDEDTKLPISAAEFLNQTMTPVRKATISPMLVEVGLNHINAWHQISLKGIPENYKEYLHKFQMEKFQMGVEVVYNKAIKFCYEKDKLLISQYETITHEDFVNKIITSGFRIPTRDEWEYIYGGASHSLFPWGNDWDDDENPEEDSDIPNQFGVKFSYQSDELELLMDSIPFIKSGDYSFDEQSGITDSIAELPFATYYRGSLYPEEDDIFDIKSDIGDCFYRRLLRLDALDE